MGKNKKKNYNKNNTIEFKNEKENISLVNKTEHGNYLNIELIKKEEEIKNLNTNLLKIQEILNNSIPIVEFKKRLFLLEEAKNNVLGELENTKKRLIKNKIIVKETKKENLLLVIISLILLIFVSILLYIKI